MKTDLEPRLFPEKKRDARCPMAPSPSHREFADLQRGQIWDGTQPWLITDIALFKQLISDPRVSNDVRNDGYPSATAAFKELRTKGGYNTFDRRDGEEHSVIRRILVSYFSPKRMEALRPAVQRHLNAIFDGVIARGAPVDLVKDIAFPYSSAVLFELVGIPHSDYASLADAAYGLISSGSSPEQAAQAYVELKAYLGNMIDCVTPDQDNGILSTMVNEQMRKGVMTHDQVLDTVILIVSGGYETTANTISLATYALTQQLDQYADLRDNIDNLAVLRGAIEELLRLTSVTHFGRRRVATADIEVGDITIRNGEGIIFLEDVTNRDPEVFGDNPDLVNIRRDARRHVSFAYGPHACAGNLLARLELLMFFQTLVKRMPGLKLACDPASLKFLDDAQVFGVRELPVTW